MLKLSKFVLAAILTATLAACGGGDSSSLGFSSVTSTANVSTPVTALNAAAVVNTPFSFPAGVPAFGTTGTATTLALTNTAASPTFSITSGGRTATGVTTFGSCIVTVTASTFLPPSPLAVGQSITINPCSLNVGTSGGAANGSSNATNVSLVLGTVASSNVVLPVIINPNGSVVINNVIVGTVTVAVVTGGS